MRYVMGGLVIVLAGVLILVELIAFLYSWIKKERTEICFFLAGIGGAISGLVFTEFFQTDEVILACVLIGLMSFIMGFIVMVRR